MNIQPKSIYGILVLVIVWMTACSDDDPTAIPFGVAFETTALGLDANTNSVEAVLTFTTAALQDHTITIAVEEAGVAHGVEYTTTPAISDGNILIDVPAGSTQVKFTIARAVDYISPGTSVKFTISNVSGENDPIIQGNVTLDLSFEAISSPNGTFDAKVGGPGQPNMVFIDLSLASQTSAARIDWDLGFYNGSEDKVILNYSTFMLAKALDKTDMNSVGATDTVGFADVVAIAAPGSDDFVDDPDGDLTKTAIHISEIDRENKVFIINLGGGPGSDTPNVGSHNVATTPRGWKKVRILKSGSNYKVQYANIGDTDFQEATITKKTGYSFSYFSLLKGDTPVIAPNQAQWDFVFTPCTNILSNSLAYGFSDFILTNRHGGTTAYMIDSDADDDGSTDEGKKAYDDFTTDDVADSNFSTDANTIGSSWRNVFSRATYADRYYIIKDVVGNLYKVQFTALSNESGVRGYPSLKYQLL